MITIMIRIHGQGELTRYRQQHIASVLMPQKRPGSKPAARWALEREDDGPTAADPYRQDRRHSVATFSLEHIAGAAHGADGIGLGAPHQ